MNRFLPVSILFLLVACSIVEDSDITSLSKFDQLKLKSIEITQQVSSGQISQKVVVDSIVETTVNGTALKRVFISWPDVLPTSKLRFKSGITSNIKIILNFRTDGQVYSCFVRSNNIDYESYIFLYTVNDLTQLVTTILDNVTKTTLYSTQDLFDPPGGFFAIRNSIKVEKRALLGGDPIYQNNCIVKFPFRYNYPGGLYLNSKQYSYCYDGSLYSQTSDTEMKKAGFYVIGNRLPEEIFISNTSTGAGILCCSDKYYFHPFLITACDLRFRIMYAPDWWEEQTSPSSSFAKDESVKLRFNYEAK